MKNTMKRMLALMLVLCTMVSMAIPAYAAENNYTCSDYTDCTANGSEIYIVTKGGCPIREEPHNKGKIYARAEKGQLLAVKRVFWTIKMTRWCEIETDSGKSLYVHIDNVEPEVHDFISLLSNNNGSVEFCTICGVAKAEAGGKSAVCDFTCVADQAVKGSFSDYNPSFTSVMAQIVAGEVLGPIADGRDLVADIMNGESGWIIAMDLVAFFPIIGALKYSDEIAILGKNADELSFVARNADEAKAMNYLPWGRWEDYDKVMRDGQEYVKLGDFYYSHHAVDEFTPAYIKSNRINGVEHSRGISPTYVNYMITEGVTEGVTLVKPAKYGCMSYTNGIFEIIMDGDVVVTIKRMG